MTEIRQGPEGQSGCKIISGPEKMYNFPSKIPYAEVTVYEVGDLQIKRDNWLKGVSTWHSVFKKDLLKINQGSINVSVIPYIDVRDGDGIFKINAGIPYDDPKAIELYDQTIAFLTSLGIELPKPDPKYRKLEELILPYLQMPRLGEKVKINKGDFIAEWDSSMGNFLVHIGEVDAFEQREDEFAKMRLARGLNAKELNFATIKFKRKPFYLDFQHFTPKEQHIAGAYWTSEIEDSRPASIFAFSKFDKKTFEMIKKEADPLAEKG